MADEMIDIVDEAHMDLGVASKQTAHLTGLWHYSIHCWLFFEEANRYFLVLQRRSSDKDLFPGMLDISAAGHYKTGERPEDGVREIVEELGIKIDFESLIDLGLRTEVAKVGPMLNREFCRVYMSKIEGFDALHPDGDEVDGVLALEVNAGLKLFGGEVESVTCRARTLEGSAWVSRSFEVSTSSFIPRFDPYYHRVLSLVELASIGYPHLIV